MLVRNLNVGAFSKTMVPNFVKLCVIVTFHEHQSVPSKLETGGQKYPLWKKVGVIFGRVRVSHFTVLTSMNHDFLMHVWNKMKCNKMKKLFVFFHFYLPLAHCPSTPVPQKNARHKILCVDSKFSASNKPWGKKYVRHFWNLCVSDAHLCVKGHSEIVALDLICCCHVSMPVPHQAVLWEITAPTDNCQT